MMEEKKEKVLSPSTSPKVEQKPSLPQEPAVSGEPKAKLSQKTKSPISGLISTLMNAIHRINPLRLVAEFHRKAKEPSEKKDEI